MLLQGELALSQPQVEDLMFLRKVYLLRRHELGLQRADLIEQMQQTRLHSVVSLAGMSQVTQQLQQNAAATMWTKYRFAWSLFLGVSSVNFAPRLNDALHMFIDLS